MTSHNNQHIPIEIGSDGEPTQRSIVASGLTCCAVVSQLDETQGAILSDAIREDGKITDDLVVYKWVTESISCETLSFSSFFDCLDSEWYLFLLIFSEKSKKMIFRHQDSEMLLFIGSAEFVKSCQRIVGNSSDFGIDEMVCNGAFHHPEVARAAYRTFVDKYNCLESFVGA